MTLEQFMRTPTQRLRDRADYLRRQARMMRQGVSFYGEHPAVGMERDAADLEAAANALEREKKEPKQ